MKRILSIILTAALIIGLIPITSVNAAVPDRISIQTDISQEITKENANDVLGDGTVSYDYDTNTLTLNGADLTGIFADGDLNILLTGSENTVVGPSGSSVIYVYGDLSISGNGTLTVEADENYGRSYGIYVHGNVTIDGANVTAKSDDVLLAHSDSYETSYAMSKGVYAAGNIDIKGKGSLTAIGGKTRGYTADSNGVDSRGINVYDGKLYAESGEAEATGAANSMGVFVVLGDFNILDVGSEVDVKGGFGKIAADSKESRTFVTNSGVYLLGGNVNINAGKVNIYSEGTKESADSTFGIEAGVSSGYNDETDTLIESGGFVNISSDYPDDTFINISSLYGNAILAEKDLSIDKLMNIAEPVTGKAKPYRFKLAYGSYYFWTVVDGDGEPAKSVNIKASGDVDFLLGDVDDDGKTTASDALLVLKHSAKLLTLRGYGKTVADIEYDEKINADDALRILKWAARIEE